MVPEKTLCIVVEEERILLGMKKEGFGKGKWNGFGGAVEEGETVLEAALRELREEAGIEALQYSYAGKIMFRFDKKPEWDQLVHIYLVKKWSGTPAETDEMLPKWFNKNEIPYFEMWTDDILWLPKVIRGKTIDAEFVFEEDGEKIKNYKINLP